MKIALVDDNTDFHIIFRKTLIKHDINADCALFCDSEEFISSIKNTHFDAVFMDVDLSSVNGIEVAQYLHALNINIPIIFITNFPGSVFHAFGLNVLDFIPKSKLDNEIEGVWKKVLWETNRKLSVTLKLVNNGILNVLLDSVDYCQIELRQLVVYVNKKRFVLSEKSLIKLYDSFNCDWFIFVNRSCFVNIQRVEIIKDHQLKLFDYNEMLDISRNRYSSVMDLFYKIISC